jgi:hypothetical protein
MSALDLSKYDFAPVRCDNRKENGHVCGMWLGEIEISRPNISKHRCKSCGVTYRNVVDADGVVYVDRVNGETTITILPAKVRSKCL